jgi:hypothetical protein
MSPKIPVCDLCCMPTNEANGSRLGRRRQLFKLLAGTRVRVFSKLAFR